MRIGKRGTASDAFVQEVWFEGVPVSSVWYEGVKLYPDERTVVRDLVLEAPPELSYWVHVCRAVSDGVSNARMVATIAGRRFHMGSGDGSLPVLREVGGAWRADASAGLLLHECLHAVVTVEAEVPERIYPVGPMGVLDFDSNFMSHFTASILPAIDGYRDGTMIKYTVSYGGWIRAAYTDRVVLSTVAGNKFFYAKKEDTTRKGTFSESMKLGVSPVEESVNNLDFSHSMDMDFTLVKNVRVVYPAFRRSWNIKVLGCTLQRRK